MEPTDFPTGVDAVTDTIGELVTVPEANLDGQMLEIVSGDDSYQEKACAYHQPQTGSNAYEQDGSLDTALIDLLPF